MRWFFFTYVVFVNYFIIDTNTWLCICLFLKSDECIKWTVILNIYMRKVWISYNIITVWCIQIIWFDIVDVWVNSSTSPLLRNVKNIPLLFPYWQRKNHNYLFYFCKIVPQYNLNYTWKLVRLSISWASSINWSCGKSNDILNCLLE